MTEVSAQAVIGAARCNGPWLPAPHQCSYSGRFFSHLVTVSARNLVSDRRHSREEGQQIRGLALLD